MRPKDIHIIIVNWNGKSLLTECLVGINRQTYKKFSITVVDNGSNDGSVDYIKCNFPNVNIIGLTKNFGFSTANNIALKNVQTEFVALLNNDAVPHPEWLENNVTALEENSEAGFVASKMLFYDDPKTIDRVGDAYTKAGTASLRGRGKLSDQYKNPEWIFGACAGAAIYRTSMIEDIGFFDEDFFLINEDVDLSFRAQLRGYKCLYVPDAIVYHKVSKSIKPNSPTSVYYGHRNLEWVYLQNMPKSLILKTIIPHLIYNLSSLLYFTVNGSFKPFVKAKWHAIKGVGKALEKRKHIQQNKKVDDNYIWDLFEDEIYFPVYSSVYNLKQS